MRGSSQDCWSVHRRPLFLSSPRIRQDRYDFSTDSETIPLSDSQNISSIYLRLGNYDVIECKANEIKLNRITVFHDLIDIFDPFAESVPQPRRLLTDGNIERMNLCHLLSNDGTDFRIAQFLSLQRSCLHPFQSQTNK